MSCAHRCLGGRGRGCCCRPRAAPGVCGRGRTHHLPPPRSGAIGARARRRWWRQRLRRAAAALGLRLWVSEFGTGRGAAALAQHIVRDLATLLPSAWVFWQAVEDEGSGWGLVEAPITSVALAALQPPSKPTGHQAGRQDASVAASRRPHAVTLMPGFYVLKFLRQALPPGSVLFRVPALRDAGFGVARSPSHAVLITLNAASSAPMRLAIDVSDWVGAAGDGGDAGLALQLSVLHLEGLAPVRAPPPDAGPAALAAACAYGSSYVEHSLGELDTSGILRLEVPAASLAAVHVCVNTV